jgi:hypothetical protein
MSTPCDEPETAGQPLVVGVDMGYGHNRPAVALAEALGVRCWHADREPLAGVEEQAVWRRSRRLYEWLTRSSTLPVTGAALRPLVRAMTGIAPLHPPRDLSRPDWAVKRLERELRDGLGTKLVEQLRASGRPLLTTYFAPAHAADAAGLERIYCVVTDSDVHRVWVPRNAVGSRIVYLVPSPRALRRLRAYGVAPENVHFTGFPLPAELLGGEDLPVLRANLLSRLVRLDPRGAFREGLPAAALADVGSLSAAEEGRPPLVTFAVGGAGAQSRLVHRFLPGLRRAIGEGTMRVALVAGTRRDTAAELHRAVSRSGMSEHLGERVTILHADSLESYFPAFNALLAETDVLWTKPGEVTFFGALGLPLVLTPPVGSHESYNGRWARESGVGLLQRDPRRAGDWLREWLEDGVLAAAAWAGYTRLPRRGLYRILRVVSGG